MKESAAFTFRLILACFSHRRLLHEFRGSRRRALAAWYQGPASVRRHGIFRSTRTFVAAVLALEQRGV